MSPNWLKELILFQSIIFVDMEGTPVQELSAIEVDTTQRKKRVLDVFHAYGNYSAGDHFARDHIHGLSEKFLLNHSIVVSLIW